MEFTAIFGVWRELLVGKRRETRQRKSASIVMGT